MTRWSLTHHPRTPARSRTRRFRPLAGVLSLALAVIGLPLTALPAAAADVNLAGTATVSASSQNTTTGQTAAKAVDGVVAGYPADYTKEWATSGGGAGSYINLVWSTPVTINKVVLYDRPNTSDRVTGGQLTFSSGAAVSVGSLNNTGTATTVTFSARTVTSLRFTINSVSSLTENVGLAEIEVWGSTSTTPANRAPVANAGADASAFTGTPVTLDGSGSTDADGDGLTYNWTPPSGITLTNPTTAKPSFTPTAAGQYTFTLVVNDGKVNSAADTVVVTVSTPGSTSINVARTATATASSQNTTTGQTAAKAIDGVASGYPTAPANEWATVGGRGGSWIELTWPAAVTIDKVVLYDRPNTTDRVSSGQLTFSSGAAVSVGSLTNNGAATTVTFSSRTVTSLRLTINSVSSGTTNIGLAEIEVWGTTATPPANRAPVANAGADFSATTGMLVTLDASGSSDPDGNTLTYTWTAPSGVSLSNASALKPTFTPASKGSYTFTLVVSDGKLSSPADSVTVTVTDPAPTLTNLARTATPTASSQNTTTGQTAAKANDGVASGYPTAPANEWATVGGRGGSTLTLTWPGAVTIEKVVLYDRPNLNDQVNSATLVFSHGDPVAVGTLNNDGTATTIVLPGPRPVTSLTLRIDSVSGLTENVGLAEIEAFGTVGGTLPNRPPVAEAGPALNVITGRTVTLDGTDSEDPDGDALSFSWTASGGTLTGETTATPTFKADTPGEYTLTLVVNDGEASSAPDTVKVTVAANKPPTANAGTDQSVGPDTKVTLKGTGTDPENEKLTYQWTGPAGMTLSDPTAASPTFAAGAAGSTYTFTLTVTDPDGLSASDDVVVTVEPLGVLTVANSGTSATWTANFESTYSGKNIKLQMLRFATAMGSEMKNYVATASWVDVQNKNANTSGDATFTITDPLEVQHTYRAVVDQGGATQKYTNELAYEAPRTTKATGLATIYIDTNETEAIATKDDYWEGKFTMDAPDGSRCTSVTPATMKVSGRGNSTWDLPKKPYKFALDKAVNLCGMGSFKKWNLIANYEDDSFIRNSLVMKMGSVLTGLEWTPKSTPVDVYVNGKFQGSYTLMDRVTVDKKGRINIDELKGKDKNGNVINDTGQAVTGGYLLEWDNRRTSMNNVFVGSSARTKVVGSEQTGAYNGAGWVGIKEPEDETDGTGINAAQLDYIDAYLETANAEIKKGNWQPYIDANSAADYIIAMELTKNYGANMRSSVFMYKKRDADPAEGDQGKLYFGPLWDFDTSFGNSTEGGASEATTSGWWVSEPDSGIKAVQGTPTWFHSLMDSPEFQTIVKNRWAAKSAELKSTATSFITSEKAFIAKSAAADNTVWGSNNLDTAVSDLQTWFNARWTWLDGQW